MNEHFVNIKVDREERPDVDAIYMKAVQAMTGRGGWPMTVFLTPDGEPFYGGTYFPPDGPRTGMPGFPRVLDAVADAYADRPRRGRRAPAGDRSSASRQASAAAGAASSLDPRRARRGVRRRWRGAFDAPIRRLRRRAQVPAADDARASCCATGSAPATPTRSHMVELTLDADGRTAASTTSSAAASTATRSTSAGWCRTSRRCSTTTPSCAPLPRRPARSRAIPSTARVAEETLDYVLREMTTRRGRLLLDPGRRHGRARRASSSSGTPAEIDALLGAEAARVALRYWDVTDGATSRTATSCTSRATREEFAAALGPRAGPGSRTSSPGSRRPLRAPRAARPARPGREGADGLERHDAPRLRRGARALWRPDYLEIAERNADFLLPALVRDGRLLRTWKDGLAKLNGYLEDHAILIDGLLALHEATFDQRWLGAARGLARSMVDLFWDPETEGFFDTGRDHEALVVRPRSLFDSAVPCGSSVAADVLLRLAVADR